MTEKKKLLTEKMIRLIACMIQGTIPEKEQLSQTDLDSLYCLTKVHSLTAIVCMALERADAFSIAEENTVRKWKDAKDKVIRKNMLLDAEREQIFTEMEKAGIWYLPLKGCILKELYPLYGMRQMSDNDILYDATRKKDVKNLFLTRGYTMEKGQVIVHSVYLKPPVYNFEMHTDLFSDTYNPELADYYSDVKKRLVPDKGKTFGMHFTEEDFYIYMTAHAYKHYKQGGTGFRTLLDIYVFDREKPGVTESAYVSSELKKLGIAEFEKESRELARKLFASKQPFTMKALTEKEKKMFCFYMESGVYGTKEAIVKNRFKKIQKDEKRVTLWDKLKYYRSRLFPEREWYKNFAPFVYRHPYLISFFCVYRIIRGLLFQRKKLSHEIDVVRKL